MTNTNFIERIKRVQEGLNTIFESSVTIDNNKVNIKMLPIKSVNKECKEFNITIPINAESIVLKNAWNVFLHYCLYEETSEEVLTKL